MHIRTWLVSAAIVLLAPLGFVAAESIIAPENIPASVPTEAPTNTTSCFDYYNFGSVQANLNAEIANTVSGVPITFMGTLENANPYPIVDGSLYVKVFKTRSGVNDGNGHDVVDQFFVKSDIVIPAKSSVPITFQWHAPSYAQSGDYQLAAFFTTSRKFNLLGLSFTDDVVGNTVSFKMRGEQNGIVKFDKAGVTVNGNPYYFAASPPRTDASSPVVVSGKVRNTTDTVQTATVRWSVYQWDAQLRENVVQEESKEITVPAGGSANVAVTVQDTKYPVYYVVGTLVWQDTQSIIGARFVREGRDRARINFPGVMSFPLVAGQENTLFSCLHNSGSSGVLPNGNLHLTLADRDGNTIQEYKYSGDITSQMMGLASQFTPKKNYDYFTLSARLYNGETFVDEANLVFDCQAIDPSLCSGKAQTISSVGDVFGSATPLAITGFGVLLLGIMLWMYFHPRRNPETTQQQ